MPIQPGGTTTAGHTAGTAGNHRAAFRKVAGTLGSEPTGAAGLTPNGPCHREKDSMERRSARTETRDRRHLGHRRPGRDATQIDRRGPSSSLACPNGGRGMFGGSSLKHVRIAREHERHGKNKLLHVSTFCEVIQIPPLQKVPLDSSFIA